MVAVGFRCSTCRQRKIKCDRQAPICGQCQKSRRACDGPPPKYRFMNHVTQATPSAKKTSLNGREESAFQWIDHPYKQNDEIKVLDLIPMPVPMTESDLVAANLACKISAETYDGELYGVGSILQNFPPMLDESPALKAAVQCALGTNALLSLVPYHSKHIDRKLYGIALSALQSALQDPYERYSKTTLSAMVMLHRLEFLANTTGQSFSLGPSYSTLHTAGVSSVLTTVGPFDANDDLLFYILLEHAFPIFCQCVYRNQACYLAEPQWLSIFSKRRARSFIERSLIDLLMILFPLPQLVMEMRKLKKGLDQTVEITEQAKQISGQLLKIDRTIEKLLNDRSQVECQRPSSSVRDVYRSNNVDFLNICIIHAVGSIIVNNILMMILTGAPDCNSIQELKERNVSCSRRIWMLHEEAQNLCRYPTALMLSYQAADTAGTADWIVATMNAIQGRSSENKSPLWTSNQVWVRCLMASGMLDFVHYEKETPLVDDVYESLHFDLYPFEAPWP